jgi:DNA replication licensing factor MCM7
MLTKEDYNVYKPDFELEKAKLSDFIQTFVDRNIKTEDELHGRKKYMIELQKIANQTSKLLRITVEDLDLFFQNDASFSDSIKLNTKRYLNLLYDVADKAMPKRTLKNSEDDIEPIEEVILNQRMANLNANNGNGSDRHVNKDQIPPELLRKFEIIIVPGGNEKRGRAIGMSMRELKAKNIGSLVSIDAIVVRVSDVRPFLRVATYACDVCGHETYQIISSKTYMPLIDCPSSICTTNQSRGKLYNQQRQSKFVSFQEIKVQEPSHHVPVGHVPRSLTILAVGQSVKQCSPGDSVTINGIYLPSSIQNTIMQKSKLIHDTYIESFEIIKHKINEKKSMPEDFYHRIGRDRSNKYKDIYSALSRSIAPEIFGMEDVKKALLLLMVGGVTKQMTDGMKIRGNVNALLMGDPGVAKSQLLKYIAHLVPRGVYTTGKGSSGVGLTAAVVKDPMTNDLVLEGGALVLADMGICCIDEFDKMTDYDRANIHEVMEQQTVSIAKAGITTRLNARASVLAAANPVYGRYNKKMTPVQNINLPAALLSRFDLIFLLLDTKAHDEDLAKYVTQVHQQGKAPTTNFEPLSSEFIRSYVAEARKNEPVIPKELHNFIVQKYVDERKKQNDITKEGYQYITPRTLLAILRLSQSLAKLRFSDEVEQGDVDEALRIIDVSRKSISDEDGNSSQTLQRADATSSAFSLIREVCTSAKNKTVKYTELERRLLQKGFNVDTIQETVNEYTRLNVLLINNNKTEITLL